MVSNLSKRELQAVCELLAREVPVERFQSILASVKQSPPAPTPPPPAATLAKKPRQEMDFSKYPFQKVAFRVAYFGHEFQGLQCANPQSLEDDKTVEWSFFQALRKVKLIPEDESALAEFSRCGRTDRGVSALGQVLSLRVRANQPGKPEIDYADVLNRSLPDDIFVLAYAPLEEASKFDARFSCTSRTYRYFFRPGTHCALDLQAMARACALFEGTHDFRNFCKIDLSNARAFVRRIDSCAIHASDVGGSFVEIKGSGFLWHQIRLMMSVLFHVGAGLERPEIVSEMLDIAHCPGRPSFTMAEDLPLVLYASEYGEEKLDWRSSERSTQRLLNRLEQKLGREEIQSNMTRMFLDTIKQQQQVTRTPAWTQDLVDLDHEEICTQTKRNKHVPFMQRPKCKSVDERLADEDKQRLT